MEEFTVTLRKRCPRCGTTSTSNAYGSQYWGIVSKIDGKLICKECGIDEVYNRMFAKDVDDKE